MALELVLIAPVIDAHERRDVAMVDIAGAFLASYMDKDVIMVL